MPLFIVCAATVALMALLIILIRRRWPWAAACWAYYVIVLAPVLGVAQSGPQLVADRYSYLSCLSWAALLGGFFFYWLQSFRQMAKPAPLITATVVIFARRLS